MSFSTSLWRSDQAYEVDDMLAQPKKKNRNIKGLQIAQEAAKPGTLTPATVSPAHSVHDGLQRLSRPHNANSSNASAGSTPSLNSSCSSPSMPSSAFSSSSNGHVKLSNQLANLELGIEFKLDLRAEDLEMINELGSGNGGTVSRVRHIPTGAIMARKVIHIDAKPVVRKQILRELQIMHDCNSPYIVSFYGAYPQDPHICMCMEYMDKGSLDNIYKTAGPVGEDVLGKIACAVVSGLTYLYDAHRIIHRDVKPSNVLVNSSGQIKICDFGVSGELINSVADTFVGTSTYMSPERIQGAAYTVRSDVWSLGITLLELALGRFPFAPDGPDSDTEPSEGERTLSPVKTRAGENPAEALEKAQTPRKVQAKDGPGGGMSILELLQHVVNEPAPRLPEGRFKPDFINFVDKCLDKDVAKRPTPKALLKHKWIIKSSEANVDLEHWAQSLP